MKYFNRVFLSWAALSALWLMYWLWVVIHGWYSLYHCVPSADTLCLSSSTVNSESFRTLLLLADVFLIGVYGIGVPLAVLVGLMIGLWVFSALKRRRGTQPG